MRIITYNNIYPPTLSGCRKGHSTITSLHLIRDTCIRAMKSSELTILTLIDFSKAFDTLNYNKLLALLSDLNFSSSSIKLISSYLTNRKQFISFSNQQSDILKISSGVPQGSILGPILFNIYISSINIKSSSSSNTVTNYVDDFQVAASCKPSNLHTSSNQIKKTLHTIKNLASDLDLQFNFTKTKYLLISTKQLSKYHNLQIALPSMQINSNSIYRTNSHKNLGVHFDQHLEFNNHHIQSLKSAYATLNSLHSLKYLLPTKSKLILIDSLIFSKATYANTITFPNISKSWLLKYHRLFKCCLSFAYNTYINTSSLPNFKVLNFVSRYKYNLLSLAYKSLYFSDSPEYLRLQLYIPSRIGLRSATGPSIQDCSTPNNTFQNLAATAFNNLPPDLRTCSNLSSFKTRLKNFLLRTQYS